MAKIDFEKLLLDYIKFKEKLPHYKYIAPQQIPYFFNKLLEKQGLEYKDGKIVEIKQEPSRGEYGDMRISKDFEDRFNGINEKLCELQDKLGDIYAIVSKQKQENPFWKDAPNPTPLSARQCWFPDGTCMNPYRDCVNCPRPYGNGNKSYTSTTTSINPNKVMYDEIPINNQEKKD